MNWHKGFFYHLFPLGCFDAPHGNDHQPASRIRRIEPWLDHMAELGVDVLLLGPVFESETHGYDVTNYFMPDSRLGTDEDFAWMCGEAHRRDIRVVFDGVFNHVGRSFWAFQDVLRNGDQSRFLPWFHITFGKGSPLGDPFSYKAWRGHDELVTLNTDCPEVRGHLFHAVAEWIARYNIDGVRLDSADCLDFSFQHALADHCRRLKPEFYCLGEVIHGDYPRWLTEGGLDAVTNYIQHKGLWSAHNDANYFELAHTCARQFEQAETMRSLYAFADNHDVTRIADRLKNPAHLYPLHILLFTLPGAPSVYYGSECGIGGIKKKGQPDWPIRPPLTPESMREVGRHPDLEKTIARLACLRRNCKSLWDGDFRNLAIASRQYAFLRAKDGETSAVLVNAAANAAALAVSGIPAGMYRDILNEEDVSVPSGTASIMIPPCWGRILVKKE